MKYLIEVRKNESMVIKIHNKMEGVRPNILVKEISEKGLCHLWKEQTFSCLILRRPSRTKRSCTSPKRDKLPTGWRLQDEHRATTRHGGRQQLQEGSAATLVTGKSTGDKSTLSSLNGSLLILKTDQLTWKS